MDAVSQPPAAEIEGKEDEEDEVQGNEAEDDEEEGDEVVLEELEEGPEGVQDDIQGLVEGDDEDDDEDDDEEEEEGDEEELEDEGEENGAYESAENTPPPVSAVYMVDQGGVGQEVVGHVASIRDEGRAEGDEMEEGARRWTVPGSGQGPLGFNEFDDPNQQQAVAMAEVEEEDDEGKGAAMSASTVGVAAAQDRRGRVAVHPPPESLDFIGENCVVFVGDFNLRLSSLQLARNERIYSHTVTDRKGWEWRLMLIPDGNSAESVGHLSVFVEHVNKEEIRNAEPGFLRDLRLGFALLPSDPSHVRTSDTLNKPPLRHTFTYKNADFGYPRCWLRSDVCYGEPPGVYANEHGIIRIATFLEDAKDNRVPPGHNSKLETGMVGLKNQGATCYMNSLLQTLFHVPSLRKAVYDMPTGEESSVTSMALALQRVFYRLQTSDRSVGTKELTKSFGWDAYDSFTQQDVQELNRVLCDHLEDKMKGTQVEGTIQRLFEGSIRSYIKCVDVSFTSSRVETYYDIQLDVKGCKDIHESFGKYVAEELLDGDNKYDAGEEHGRQDAKKGVKFLRFPPVLTIHLKRFEYDMATGNMVKVNDRFMFPEEMNIDEYLDEEAERDPERPNRYILHSILVHSGDVHGGHYFAYIRPNGKDWCKFNDDVVTQVDESEAIEGNYGAGPDVLEAKYRDPYTFFPRVDVPPGGGGGGGGRGWVGGDNTSAYMLVYVRECDLAKTMINLEAAADNGIPRRLRDRFQTEEDEQQRKLIERNEAHLYYNLRIARDCDLEGLRVFLNEEFVKWDDTLTVKVKKRAPVEEVTRAVARAMGIRPDRCRLWFCCSRENKTIRPESALQGPFDNGVTLQDICLETGPPKTLGGQESYSFFVDEVGKYEAVEAELEDARGRKGRVKLEPRWEPKAEGDEGSDAKRLRLDRTVKTEESGGGDGVGGKGGDGMVGKLAGSPRERDGRATLADEQEDEHAMVEAVRRGIAYPAVAANAVLVFFKYYEPQVKPLPCLAYVGHALLRGDDSTERLAEEAVRLARLPRATVVDLYEQVTPRSVNHLPQDKTLSENELQHGDIVLFQRKWPPAPLEQVKSVKNEMEVDLESRNCGQGAGAGAVGDDAAASPAPVPPAGVKQEGAGGAANGAGTGSSGAGAEAGGAAVDRKARTWTGIAGAERVLVDGVWRVSGGTETAKSFMEQRSSKRVVHFIGRTHREGVLLPEGSSTQDGRSPGVTIELPRTAPHREILETLCNRLEMVNNPLLLRISAMNVSGKPQTFPTRVHLSDLDLPQHALHKILEVGGGIHHSHTLIFEMAPFPLDELTHSATLVEAYSTDVILKRHCLARMEDHPVIKLARRRARARRQAAERKSAAAQAAKGDLDSHGGNGHGPTAPSKRRKLGELSGANDPRDPTARLAGGDEVTVVNGHDEGSPCRFMRNIGGGGEGGTQGCDTNGYLTCEDMVLTPPGPEDLIATYVLVKGQRTVQDILRQLARELRLSEGSEHRLRLLGVGNGEINAVIERDDDAQRFFMARSVAQNVYSPIIKDPPLGSILLEYADDEELKATCCWGKEPPPRGEPAPPAWMPLQVVLFTVNAQGKWTVLHGNPMVTFVSATDEVEDIIERYGRRRGTDALESAGLRRGRPAVIENFKPTYIDHEKEKENSKDNGLLPGLPGKSLEVDGAPGAEASHQSNGFMGNGAAGSGKESGFQGSLLWRLLCERFPHYVNRGVEDEPVPPVGKFPTLGFKKDNPNEPRSFYRRAEQGIRIRGS